MGKVTSECLRCAHEGAPSAHLQEVGRALYNSPKVMPREGTMWEGRATVEVVVGLELLKDPREPWAFACFPIEHPLSRCLTDPIPSLSLLASLYICDSFSLSSPRSSSEKLLIIFTGLLYHPSICQRLEGSLSQTRPSHSCFHINLARQPIPPP